MIYADGQIIYDWPQIIDVACCAAEMDLPPDLDEVTYANLPIEWWMECASESLNG